MKKDPRSIKDVVQRLKKEREMKSKKMIIEAVYTGKSYRGILNLETGSVLITYSNGRKLKRRQEFPSLTSSATDIVRKCRGREDVFVSGWFFWGTSEGKLTDVVKGQKKLKEKWRKNKIRA